MFIALFQVLVTSKRMTFDEQPTYSFNTRKSKKIDDHKTIEQRNCSCKKISLFVQLITKKNLTGKNLCLQRAINFGIKFSKKTYHTEVYCLDSELNQTSLFYRQIKKKIIYRIILLKTFYPYLCRPKNKGV